MLTANLVNDLVTIAEEAGEKILEIYYSAGKDWEIEFKNDTTPLTKADKISNRLICERLLKLYKNIPVLSEENKEIPWEERKNFEFYWLVDPLDGTKEFIKRNGEFTINIALIYRSHPVFGLVSIPYQKKIYYAMKDHGAYRKEHDKAPERIYVAEFNPDDRELVIAVSRSHFNEETEDFLAQYPAAHVIVAGSALKFMLVAEGKAHIYPRFGRTMEWDTAASQIIVEEAGGSVIQVLNGESMQYNKPDLANNGFLVYGKLLG